MKKIITLLVLLGTLSAFAQLDLGGVSLGKLYYAGTGCPNESVHAYLKFPSGMENSSTTTLGILFDRFTVEAGGETQRRLERKTCSLMVPIHVPQGLSFSISKIEYPIMVNVPRGGFVDFTVEYFVSSSNKITMSERFFGGGDDPYQRLSKKIAEDALVWSPCGQDATYSIRIKSAVNVITDSALNPAMAAVEFADFSPPFGHQLRWKTCN